MKISKEDCYNDCKRFNRNLKSNLASRSPLYDYILGAILFFIDLPKH